MKFKMRPVDVLKMGAREQAFLVACLLKEDEEIKKASWDARRTKYA